MKRILIRNVSITLSALLLLVLGFLAYFEFQEDGNITGSVSVLSGSESGVVKTVPGLVQEVNTQAVAHGATLPVPARIKVILGVMAAVLALSLLAVGVLSYLLISASENDPVVMTVKECDEEEIRKKVLEEMEAKGSMEAQARREQAEGSSIKWRIAVPIIVAAVYILIGCSNPLIDRDTLRKELAARKQPLTDTNVTQALKSQVGATAFVCGLIDISLILIASLCGVENVSLIMGLLMTFCCGFAFFSKYTGSKMHNGIAGVLFVAMVLVGVFVPIA